MIGASINNIHTEGTELHRVTQSLLICNENSKSYFMLFQIKKLTMTVVSIQFSQIKNYNILMVKIQRFNNGVKNVTKVLNR
jgi:hypothetical protein